MASKAFTLGSDEPAAFTNIESAPKIAEQVGLIFATFAMIETRLPQIFSWITGMSSEDAASSLNSVRSFGTRISIVEAAIINHSGTPKPQRVATWFCTKMREANTLRNRYAHSHYRFVSEIEVKVLPYGDEAKVVCVTLEEMEADVANLRKLAGQLFELFRLGRVPLTLYEELQRLP
jgi:hypothetical protein